MIYTVPEEAPPSRYWMLSFDNLPYGEVYINKISFLGTPTQYPAYWTPQKGSVVFSSPDATLDDLAEIAPRGATAFEAKINPSTLYEFNVGYSGFFFDCAETGGSSWFEGIPANEPYFVMGSAMLDMVSDGGKSLTLTFGAWEAPFHYAREAASGKFGVVVESAPNPLMSPNIWDGTKGSFTLSSEAHTTYRIRGMGEVNYVYGMDIDGVETFPADTVHYWYTVEGTGNDISFAVDWAGTTWEIHKVSQVIQPDASIGNIWFQSRDKYLAIGMQSAGSIKDGTNSGVVLGSGCAVNVNRLTGSIAIGTNVMTYEDTMSDARNNIAIGDYNQTYQSAARAAVELDPEFVAKRDDWLTRHENARLANPFSADEALEIADREARSLNGHNVSIGYGSLRALRNDSADNVAVGSASGEDIYGKYNTFIGTNTGGTGKFYSPVALSGSVAIGCDQSGKGAKASKNNEIAIGASTHNTVVAGTMEVKGSMTVKAPTTDLHAATKKYVDDAIAAATAVLQAEVAELRARLG